METDDFIERLVRDVRPVTPLQKPWLRAATWLLGAVVYIGALTLMMTSSADVTANGTTLWYLVPQVAALATSAAAATAAFASVVPAASPRVMLWPAAAVVVWLGSLLLGSVQEWPIVAAVSLAPPHEWLCVAVIALVAGLPLLGMARMLRHGAPLSPRLAMALAVLAAASMANVAVCVSHPHTSSTVMLLWHGTTVLVLVAVGSWMGRSVLSWDRLRHLT